MQASERAIFISYRRDGGADVARVLQAFFEKHGFEVFLDVDALDSGQFDNQLLSKIASSQNFVMVCTPGSLDRCQEPDDWVRRELAHAIKHGLRIIPVTLPGFTWPAKGVLPSEIAAISDHNAFEYAHTHWKFTSTKLLKMVSLSTASRPTRDTSTATDQSAIARADPVAWKQSVEDRLALARMREYREYLNGLDGSRRIDVIESALDETNDLPTEEVALREVACFRATIVLELWLIHQGAGRFAAGALESVLGELRTPAIFAAPTDEQLTLIVRLERVVADHRRAARTAANGNAQGQQTLGPSSAEGTRHELPPTVADDSAESPARADSQIPPLSPTPTPTPTNDAADSTRPLTSPSVSQTAPPTTAPTTPPTALESTNTRPHPKGEESDTQTFERQFFRAAAMTFSGGIGLIAIAWASRELGSLNPLIFSQLPFVWYFSRTRASLLRLVSEPTQRKNVALLNLAVGFCMLVAWGVVLFT
jgi:hypothetical protein